MAENDRIVLLQIVQLNVAQLDSDSIKSAKWSNTTIIDQLDEKQQTAYFPLVRLVY